MLISKFTLQRRWFFGCVLLTVFALATHAQDVQDTSPPIDPQLAIKQFKVPDNFKIDLWASEPQLKNPVSFCFDELGRVFVSETFRYKTSVYDIRDHLNMYYDDLASRSIADRAAMIRRYLGTHADDLVGESEVVQLLEDRAGTGAADHSQVFAAGFNSMLDGIGAGVLARKGKVYYTDIPNLWMLQETNGHAGARAALSTGYGVRFGYTGHDLHGLRIGPDGKLYFSCGDRGLNVTNMEGRVLDNSECGAVLRCNQDGSDLEIFATGVRNPQGLAFDEHGDLFTGDNNCDHGDAARIVYVVEGGDTGWRTAYQFSETTVAGLWNTENLWQLQFPQQAAYVLPPVAFLGDGPSGLTHYPGTGFPEAYRDHFFMCDFRGASVNSGVHSFMMVPDGAGFQLLDASHFFWHILATDADFSPDGQLFVSDWVRGWPQSKLGRIYRVSDPEIAKSAIVQETKKLLAEGMEKRPPEDLEKLLGHVDQRVRQEAQFEIVDRALAAGIATEAGRKYVGLLAHTATTNANPLARMHGIWGLGQIGRVTNSVMTTVLPLLDDLDTEVRAQSAKVLGDAKYTNAFAGLTNALIDQSRRVRFFAAQSLGKIANPEAVAPLAEMLRVNQDRDVFLRHSGVMGLLGSADAAALRSLATNSSRSVRMATLLVFRRQHSPDAALFLHDEDPLVVLEAARAINDLPIRAAMPQLADLIGRTNADELLAWRVINANYIVGGEKNATALVTYALKDGPTDMRAEAVRALQKWPKPFSRDRVTGFYRPLPERDIKIGADAVRPALKDLLTTTPDMVRLNTILAAYDLSIKEVAPLLMDALHDSSISNYVRVTALKALSEMHDPHLPDAVKIALNDTDADVRKEANFLQSKINPENAIGALTKVLDSGTTSEKQSAFTTLGAMKGESADELLGAWLDKLIAGTAPKEVQFELVQAAASRHSPLLTGKLQQYVNAQPKDDEFAGYRETLYGGDAAAGKKIFNERQDVACVRCHKINGEGGAVGPELTGIITRHDREYILESILYPNKQIAPGFDTALVETKSGQVYAGIVKAQDDAELSLFSVEDNALVKIKKSDITKQVKGQSPMPEGLNRILSKLDLRNLVEYLATTK